MIRDNELNIRFAGKDDIPVIRTMADVVFRRTYKEILSPGQMEYMMDMMYSEESLAQQVAGAGKWFCIAELDGTPAAYVSYEREGAHPDGRPLYHLQKLYVLPEYQRRHVGSGMLGFVTDHLRAENPGGFRVELNVNRNNPAVSFYEHAGMVRDRSGDFPIGSGFYMNDHIYAFDFFAGGKSVRRACLDDIPRIMEVCDDARRTMRSDGNMKQWTGGYPSEEVIRADIDRKCGFVIAEGDSVAGYFAFIPGIEDSYLKIEGGRWLDDSAPYCTVHRLAGAAGSRGIAETCFGWCLMRCRNLRVDTHEDNRIMRHCIGKAGFRYCGIIHLPGGDPRLAYQKIE